MRNDENILVVQRKYLEPLQNGFQPLTDFAQIQKVITKHQEFHARSTMEENPEYKQIIPYLVFEHNNTFFLMRRRETASEQRLKNKYSLGIGGHIRQEDLVSNSIIGWAQREFHEEVSYNGSLTTTPIGLINDDTDAVGRVHLGLVFLLCGDSPLIAIRAEHKEGRLVSIDECRAMHADLESWSQLIVNCLPNSFV